MAHSRTVVIAACGALLAASVAAPEASFGLWLRLRNLPERYRISRAEKKSLELENRALKQDLLKKYRLVGTSSKMQFLGEQIKMAAVSNSRVLILGENGTGKELVARQIHSLSLRKDEPFIEVNCAAIPEDLIESELFGHVRGAFTGAVESKRGKFELADGGTLLLDEIGEMELPVQSKLLRVLQGGEYFRLGSTKQRGADVRILAATNKDLSAAIADGRFRADLYYRLNVNSVVLPPLRDRKGDVALLAHHFLDRSCRASGKKITSIAEPVMELLNGYAFPGNLRELANVIAGAVALETGDVLGLHAMPPHLLKAAVDHPAGAPSQVRKALADIEAEHIRAVMEHTSGNRSAAARILGISRVGLIAKLKRLGLGPAQGVPARLEGEPTS